MNTYLFRIDSDNNYVKNQIIKNELRQGWGTIGLSLVNADKSIVPFKKWVEHYTWKDKESYKEGKYRNLLKMLEMKLEDFIIVPKFPELNQFTIFKVNRKYSFQLEDNINDYGHIIGIDYEASKSFHYQANEKTKLIHSKLRAYQSAINSIRNKETQEAIQILYLQESDIEPKDIAEIIQSSFFNNYNYFNLKLGDSRPNDIEKLVEKIFIQAGYQLERCNYYDRKGGDADLVFSKKLNIISDFSYDENFYQLYIQVKKRNGRDWNEMEGIYQLDQITKDLDIEKVCYSKILVSTSEFSSKVKKEAKNRNIILIDGKELTKLIIKYL